MNRKFIAVLIFSCLVNCVFAEKITFSAGNMSGQNGKKTSKTILSGNAYVKTDTIEISADRIELSGEDYRKIKAEGNVHGTNFEAKMEFSCNKMEYDRETKIAFLQGDVKLDDRENNVTAKAQIIEYNQDTEIAVMQIQITLTQKNNICKGAYAIYQKKAQMLDISGNAEVQQDKDTFRAQEISLNLDTQEITLEGNVKGSVTDDGTKSEQPKQAQKTEKKEEAVKSESGKTEEEKKETDKPESVKTEEKSEIKTEENQQTGESKDAVQN